MKRVGVYMTAVVSIGLCPPRSPKFLPLPGIVSPLAVGFPLASSIFKDLPRCSVPLNYKALFKADFLENLTKAIPLDLPSGLASKLMLRIYPHGYNKLLTSES